jgi:hypothetical protein
MLEKLFDRSLIFILVTMFFVYSVAYNIGYFYILGDSLRYFLYIPISLIDIIKTGLVLLFPLFIILIIFKPILISPIFKGSLPSGNILLVVTIILLVSILFYFVTFANTQEKMLYLAMETIFYLFSIICLAIIIYYFISGVAPQYFLIVFFLLLIPFSFTIGTTNAKFATIASVHETKSQITLKTNQVVSANILRNFDKGILIMNGNNKHTNFIAWDEIRWIKFKRVSSF